jgi:Tfp pilus assembly protein PilN
MTKKHITTIKKQGRKINMKGFWFLSITSLAILSLVYVFQVNAMTNNSYDISLLEKKVQKMSFDNEGLEVKLTQQQYLPNATLLADSLSLQKIEKIEYLNVAQGVAIAK